MAPAVHAPACQMSLDTQKQKEKAQFLREPRICMSYPVKALAESLRGFSTSKHPLCTEESQVQGSAGRSLL